MPQPMMSNAVTVSRGATVSADASAKGNGGKVTLLSSQSTVMAGTITAKGGKAGGDGGFVEVSGDKGFSVTGGIDASAPLGLPGTILFDPTDLTVINCLPNDDCGGGSLDDTLTGTTPHQVTFNDFAEANAQTISNGAIDSLAGSVLLQATATISVDPNTPIVLQNNTALTMQTQTGNITVNAGSPITATGTGIITLQAGLTRGSGGAVVLGSNLNSANAIALQADGGITLAGALTATTLDVSNLSAGGLTQTGGNIIATTLQSSLGVAGAVNLPIAGNGIANIGNFGVAGGPFSVVNRGALSIGGVLSAPSVNVTAGSIAIPGTVSSPGAVTLVATTGGITETGAILAGTFGWQRGDRRQLRRGHGNQ